MFNRIAARLHVASWQLTERARGANFLEYALLAGMVVVVGAALNRFLPGAFEGLFSRVSDALTNAGR